MSALGGLLGLLWLINMCLGKTCGREGGDQGIPIPCTTRNLKFLHTYGAKDPLRTGCAF